MQAPMRFDAGSAGAPGITFNAETGLGIFRPLSGVLAFAQGGAERLRIVNGNLLLGTTTDGGVRLNVSGTIAFTSGADTGRLFTSSGAASLFAGTGNILVLGANNAVAMTISTAGVIADNAGNELGYRKIPRVTTFNGAARGACVAVTAGFTVPASTYTAGDTFSFYNDSASAITVTQGAGLTLRLNATSNTGNRSATQRSLFTVWFNSPTEAVISGGGLT